MNVVTRIDYNNGTFTFDRDIDGGRETVSCAAPVVASAQKDLCEPRIPNMRGIMAARTKPLQLLQPQTVADFSASKSYELPTAKTGVKMIDPENASQLIDILRNEAKVI